MRSEIEEKINQKIIKIINNKNKNQIKNKKQIKYTFISSQGKIEKRRMKRKKFTMLSHHAYVRH